MKLNHAQIDRYNNDGYLFLPNLFDAEEIDAMLGQLPHLLQKEHPGRILEKNGVDVRSVFGAHQFNGLLDGISRLDRIVMPVTQLLGAPAYIYQTKINSKKALSGDSWEWHEDFPFWHLEI